ncbi:MAG TPA: hypothetical protein VI029_09800 [Mycobacterium sp.]
MATFVVSWARLAGVEAWTTRHEAALRELIEEARRLSAMLSTIIHQRGSGRPVAD